MELDDKTTSMVDELEKMSESEKMKMIRNALPYQYASIIAKRLPTITAQQVRLVFYEQISDPTITLPVLTTAWALYEEVKREKALRNKALTDLEING